MRLGFFGPVAGVVFGGPGDDDALEFVFVDVAAGWLCGRRWWLSTCGGAYGLLLVGGDDGVNGGIRCWTAASSAQDGDAQIRNYFRDLPSPIWAMFMSSLSRAVGHVDPVYQPVAPLAMVGRLALTAMRWRPAFDDGSGGAAFVGCDLGDCAR